MICDSRIENFEVSSKNETFSSEDGMLYTKDGTKLLICPKGKTGTAVVQDRALQIGMNSLDAPNEYKSENDELEAIADGRVNSNAYKQWTSPFSNCAKLEKVVIGKKVKYIYDDFSDYKWLKEIEVDAENKYFTVENGVIVAKK